MARSLRTNGIRLSGQYGSDRRAHVSLILRRFPHRLRTRGQSTRDTDTHWRERPSGQARGHCKRARPGRSRHVSCPACDIRAFQWAAKGAAHTERCRPARPANCAWRINCGHRPRELQVSTADLRAGLVGRDGGDNLISRGRPPGRPLLWVSGDVNQGREMQVLA